MLPSAAQYKTTDSIGPHSDLQAVSGESIIHVLL
jgi:hypothetical protein